MSGADFGNFAQIGSLILSVVVWIHTIVVSRSKASDNRVKNAEDNIGNVDKRVGIIEARLVSVPQTTDVHEMDLRLTKIMGNLEVLTERIKPISATMERLQEYMAANAAENIKNPRRSRSDP